MSAPDSQERLSAALDHLADLGEDTGLGQHIAVYTEVHEALREHLDAAPQS